jgi:hypothetical protein
MMFFFPVTFAFDFLTVPLILDVFASFGAAGGFVFGFCFCAF